MNMSSPKSLTPSWALIAVAISFVLSNLSAAPVKVGDLFPTLGRFQLEGALPEKLEGKVVLVDFWASWCGPCKKSFPVLNDLHKTYQERGLVILAVSVDKDRAAMEAFLKKMPASFSIVRDAGQKLVAAASVAAMPSSFLLDGHGRVRFLHTGFKGDETRQQYVKEIEELLKGD
jgi:thiol-disulfide isomerase/thioredoxin